MSPPVTLPSHMLHSRKSSIHSSSRENSAVNSATNSREGTPNSIGNKNRNTNALTSDKEKLIQTYKIDFKLTRIGFNERPTLRSVYLRWKEATRVLKLVENEGSKTSITNLFIAHTQWNKWDNLFSSAIQYSKMCAWLEATLETSEAGLWGFVKPSDRYSMSDLNIWLKRKEAKRNNKKEAGGSTR